MDSPKTASMHLARSMQVGLGAAAEVVRTEADQLTHHMEHLRDTLQAQLLHAVPQVSYLPTAQCHPVHTQVNEVIMTSCWRHTLPVVLAAMHGHALQAGTVCWFLCTHRPTCV